MRKQLTATALATAVSAVMGGGVAAHFDGTCLDSQALPKAESERANAMLFSDGLTFDRHAGASLQESGVKVAAEETQTTVKVPKGSTVKVPKGSTVKAPQGSEVKVAPGGTVNVPAEGLRIVPASW